MFLGTQASWQRSEVGGGPIAGSRVTVSMLRHRGGRGGDRCCVLVPCFLPQLNDFGVILTSGKMGRLSKKLMRQLSKFQINHQAKIHGRRQRFSKTGLGAPVSCLIFGVIYTVYHVEYNHLWSLCTWWWWWWWYVIYLYFTCVVDIVVRQRTWSWIDIVCI